jgi:hypothetical protein
LAATVVLIAAVWLAQVSVGVMAELIGIGATETVVMAVLVPQPF